MAAVEHWWAHAQVKHEDALIFYKTRGFPPWPGLVLPCKPRSWLQGPMNPLCPPEDALFDRVQSCIQRGKGMKVGDTIIARAHDSDSSSESGSEASPKPLPQRKEKAKILRVFRDKLEVEYKRSGRTQTIPKSWGELLSQSLHQHQAAGKVKRATGKVRDVALKGSKRGRVPSGFVLVYSYGDEMYRKVRAQSLIPYSPNAEELRTFRGKSLRSCLKSIAEESHRGFNGSLALREIRAEWDRREQLQKQQADLKQYRAHHNLSMPELPPDVDSNCSASTSVSDEEEAAISEEEEEPEDDPWAPSPEQDDPWAQSRSAPVFARSGNAPRNIATPVANAVRRSMPSVPVHLQGHMVPYYEQLESMETCCTPKGSDIEDARQLLKVAEDASLADLNRARRRLALQKHPDKVVTSLQSYAHEEWLKIDAAYKILRSLTV